MYLEGIGIVDVQLTMCLEMEKSKMYGTNSGKMLRKMIKLKKENKYLIRASLP